MYVWMMEKQNKRVLVTGATRGIGRAVVQKLARAGYDLLLVSSREGDLAEFRSDLQWEYPGLEISVFPADLSDPYDVHRLRDWAVSHRPDILINNVGVFKPVSILNEEEGAFLPQFYVNYYAAHTLCAAVGRQMRERGQGHILNVTSTASREPVKAGTYTVTKFALRGLTYVLRNELRGSGVKVTEIIPGSTLTSSWGETDQPREHFINPDEVADAMLFCLKNSDTAMVEELVIKPQKGNILTDC